MRRLGAFLTCAALSAAWPLIAQAAPDVGDKAPAISAPSWFNLPEGVKAIRLADLKGQVVIVEFWATW